MLYVRQRVRDKCIPSTVDVDLIADCHIVTENANVLKTSPATDDTVPADDCALDPGVLLDLGVGK